MQKYVVRSKVDKSNSIDKVRYYGVPVVSGYVTEEDLAKEICIRSSLSESDVLAALNELGRSLKQHLENGESVHLKGIGVFTVSGSSEACEKPQDCTPAKMKARRICLRADSALRSMLDNIKYSLIQREKQKP